MQCCGRLQNQEAEDAAEADDEQLQSADSQFSALYEAFKEVGFRFRVRYT